VAVYEERPMLVMDLAPLLLVAVRTDWTILDALQAGQGVDDVPRYLRPQVEQRLRGRDGVTTEDRVTEQPVATSIEAVAAAAKAR
jgi:hypothetical protein